MLGKIKTQLEQLNETSRNTNYNQWFANIENLIIDRSVVPPIFAEHVKDYNRQLNDKITLFKQQETSVNLVGLFETAYSVYSNYTLQLESVSRYCESQFTDYDFALLPLMETTHRQRQDQITGLLDQLADIKENWHHLDCESFDTARERVEQLANGGATPNSTPQSPEDHSEGGVTQALRDQLAKLNEVAPPKPEKTSEQYNKWRQASIEKVARGTKGGCEASACPLVDDAETKKYWNTQRRMILDYQKWLRERSRLRQQLEEHEQNQQSASDPLEKPQQGESLRDTKYWEQVLGCWSDFHKHRQLKSEITQLEHKNGELWTEIVYQKCCMRRQNENCAEKILFERLYEQINRQKSLLGQICRLIEKPSSSDNTPKQIVARQSPRKITKHKLVEIVSDSD